MTQAVLSLVVAMSIGVLLVPQLARQAAALGLIDLADERKSHVGAIPRVGGIAIALGALLPAAFWLAGISDYSGYFAAAAVIVAFGVWDDRASLGYRSKLFGQLFAILIAVGSGIEIRHLPFAGLDPVPGWIGLPLTVFFLIAATNAFNLLDGLDGLAGGCAMLSLGATALLAYLSGADIGIIVIAASTIGAVLGFLRHNTHPASVFMGDAGSQFLGFTIAVLIIMLMEHPANAMSAAIPLLLLGLPILDTAMVIVLRVRSGRSPFSPDRRHIHHQLLSLGLKHHQAVAAIYAAQAVFVFSAALLRFESDLLVVASYFSLCGLCITGFLVLRRMPWMFRRPGGSRSGADQAAEWWHLRARYENAVLVAIGLGLAAYLVGGALVVGPPSQDIAILALALGATMATALIPGGRWAVDAIRVGVYVAAMAVTYYAVFGEQDTWFGGRWVDLGVGILAVAVGLAIYFQDRNEFQITTLDLLIFIVALVVLAAPFDPELKPKLVRLLRAFVAFYAVELLLGRVQARPRTVVGATLVALVVLAVRGLGGF